MSHEEQERRRAWFRGYLETGVAFNAHAGIKVERWGTDGVVLSLAYAERLSAHDGVFHGGVISALIDTAGVGAVMAGHDYSKGSRVSTVALAVQFLSVAPGEGLLAEALCSRRGGSVHYAQVEVRSESSRRHLAQGLVTARITEERWVVAP